MKKLTLILLFTSINSFAQIDYQGLIRNLEEVTFNTDLETYFKDLPIKESYGDITFNDERFLRFYDVVINKVKFSNGYSGKTMKLTPFNESTDFEKLLIKLTEHYGKPNEGDNNVVSTTGEKVAILNRYEWDTETINIMLRIDIEEEENQEGETNLAPKFKSFDEFYITFKQ